MIDELAAELLDLARTRIRTRYESVHAPRFDHIVAATGFDSRLDLADAAIDTLTPDDIQTTARILFGDHPERWNLALGERRKYAGKEVGFHPETFRKKDSEGSSDYDRLARSVAEAMVQIEDAAVGPAPPPPDEAEAEDPEPAARRRTAPVAAALLLLLVAVAAVVALAMRFGGGQPGDEVAGRSVTLAGVTAPPASATVSATPTRPPPTLTERVIPPATSGCDIPVGTAINPGAIPAEATEAIRVEYERLGGVGAVGCPRFAAIGWDDVGFWSQAFAGSDTLAAGAILTRDDMPQALWMDQSQLDTYGRTAGSQLPKIAGPPIRYDDADGAPTVTLTSGDLIVAQQPGGPAFWLPVEAIDAWGGPNGKLGVPMTDVNYVDGALTQQYEFGQMALVAEDELVTFIATPTDVAAELELLSGDPPGIVRTYDGTAWWIDEEDTRRWIPTAEVWECLGGDLAVLAMEMPGWAIGSSFRLGPTMSC